MLELAECFRNKFIIYILILFTNTNWYLYISVQEHTAIQTVNKFKKKEKKDVYYTEVFHNC